MKNTIHPFSLGGNVMVEIVNGTLRQLNGETLALIKEVPVASLTEQQITAIDARRKACTEASIAQGYQKPGFVNEK